MRGTISDLTASLCCGSLLPAPTSSQQANFPVKMKSSVAHTWKSLTSKIHPPLPISRRDSQRLLLLLSGSFQQQLDREHLADSSSNENYANLQLKSILTDPLFNAKPRTPAFSTNKGQRSAMRLGQQHERMERLTDAFKERVSQGTAGLVTAKCFLRSQHILCLDSSESSAATLREAMRSSGAASLILQWLWSSGTEDTGEFLMNHAFRSNQGFIALLVPFLIAEGQHSRILRWLHRCHSPEETPFSSLRGLDTADIQSCLFVRFIIEEQHFGDGLESAITLFLRTVASLRSSGSTMRSMPYGAMSVAHILNSAMLFLPKSAEPKPSIVQPFLEMIGESQPNSRLHAELCVYFQEHPDPQPALTYFHNLSAQSLMNKSAKRRSHMVHLGLRAAELFLKDGCQTEALWIMEFLQRNFAQELGPPLAKDRKSQFSDKPQERLRSESKSSLRKEAESLHLLDTLAVQ